jgi:hypothetical protein
MSKQAFETKKDTIEAILNENVKYPNIPIDAALQEAEDLLVWCRQDKELLVKAGLEWTLVEDLSIRIGACRYIQSEWQKEYRSIEDAQREWGEKSPAAFKLRDELLHHFKHAFHNRSDLLARVKKISEGSSNADMIQDLSDLSVLGKANLDLFVNTLMETSQLDLAATTADSLSVVLANSNGEKLKDNEKRILRDKAYAHMKEAVDEIRRVGQYVFWRDELRRKGYISRYNKMVKRNSKSKKTEELSEE